MISLLPDLGLHGEAASYIITIINEIFLNCWEKLNELRTFFLKHPLDGGQKAQRPICSAVSAGIKVFEHSKIQLVTGCTRNPGTQSKFCSDHREHSVPCMLSKNIHGISELMKEKKTKTHYVAHDWTDKVFVIEEVLEKKVERKSVKYLIKFKDYSTTTWQLAENIPKFVIQNFQKGIKKVPNPRVLEKKSKGTVTEILLCKYILIMY